MDSVSVPGTEASIEILMTTASTHNVVCTVGGPCPLVGNVNIVVSPLPPTVSSVSLADVNGIPTVTYSPSPNATSYSIELYSNTTNSTTGGTFVETKTGPVSTSSATVSFTKVTRPAYYYAIVTASNSSGNIPNTTNVVEMGIGAVGSVSLADASGVPIVTYSLVPNATSYSIELYSNTTNSDTGGTSVETKPGPVPGASGSVSFTKVATPAYYYAIVTASNSSGSVSKTTNVVQMGIGAGGPVSLTDVSGVPTVTYAAATNATSYSIQLYSNTTNSATGGTVVETRTGPVPGASSATVSFSKITTPAYYYAIVTASNSGGSVSKSTNVVQMGIGTLGAVLLSEVSGVPTVTYAATTNATGYSIQLYSNSTNSATGGTFVETKPGSIPTGASATVSFTKATSYGYYYAIVTASNSGGSVSKTTNVIELGIGAQGIVSLASAGGVATVTYAAAPNATGYSVQLYSNATNSATGGTVVETKTGPVPTGASASVSFTKLTVSAYYYAIVTASNNSFSISASSTAIQITVGPIIVNTLTTTKLADGYTDFVIGKDGNFYATITKLTLYNARSTASYVSERKLHKISPSGTILLEASMPLTDTNRISYADNNKVFIIESQSVKMCDITKEPFSPFSCKIIGSSLPIIDFWGPAASGYYDSIVSDNSGNYYVSIKPHGIIRKIDSNGIVLKTFNLIYPSSICQTSISPDAHGYCQITITNMCVDSKNNIYVTYSQQKALQNPITTPANVIWKIESNTPTIFTGNDIVNIDIKELIDVRQQNRIDMEYYNSGSYGAKAKLDASTAKLKDIQTKLEANNKLPDKDGKGKEAYFSVVGNMIIVNDIIYITTNNSIRKITPDGDVKTIIIFSGTIGGSIKISPDGSIYIVIKGNPDIVQYPTYSINKVDLPNFLTL